MNILRELARILRVRDDQIEEAVGNDRRAQTQLSRRGFMAAAGVLATAPLLPPAARVWSLPSGRYLYRFALLHVPPAFGVPRMKFTISFMTLGLPVVDRAQVFYADGLTRSEHHLIATDTAGILELASQ